MTALNTNHIAALKLLNEKTKPGKPACIMHKHRDNPSGPHHKTIESLIARGLAEVVEKGGEPVGYRITREGVQTLAQ